MMPNELFFTTFPNCHQTGAEPMAFGWWIMVRSNVSSYTYVRTNATCLGDHHRPDNRQPALVTAGDQGSERTAMVSGQRPSGICVIVSIGHPDGVDCANQALRCTGGPSSIGHCYRTISAALLNGQKWIGKRAAAADDISTGRGDPRSSFLFFHRKPIYHFGCGLACHAICGFVEWVTFSEWCICSWNLEVLCDTRFICFMRKYFST